MAESQRTYDLTVILSPEADDDRRKTILAGAEAEIERAGGSIDERRDWGVRPLAFDIRHESTGHYHLIEFTGPVSLPPVLARSLRITDGVLRARVTSAVPGTPLPAPTRQPEAAEPVA